MSTVAPFPPAIRLTEVPGVCQTEPASTYLVGAFATLPENWRRALWYSDIQGLTPNDAGQLLQMGPELFSAVLHDARTALRVAFNATLPRRPLAGNTPEASA